MKESRYERHKILENEEIRDQSSAILEKMKRSKIQNYTRYHKKITDSRNLSKP